MTGKELGYIAEAHAGANLSGDGPFTKRCHEWLERRTGTAKALLTHSCTAALEMAAILLDIAPGDEVIMPSFTFVSTANAFVLRGGVPIFVDVRADTLNLDERRVEAAISPRTRAIVPVHYAGVGCEMDALNEIAARHKLAVVEDAAQGIQSTYKGRPLGTIGALGAYSFHETKNVISGEGGALLVNDPRFSEAAEIVREKGTDRSRFYRGQVDKYTWQSIGSSYLPSELIAAFLWAQLQEAQSLTERRLAIWQDYYDALAPLETRGVLRRPVLPAHCTHNAHMFYVLLSDASRRAAFLSHLTSQGIYAIFHYVPLHSSPAGRRFGRAIDDLPVTERIANQLVRLPLWIGMTRKEVAHVVGAIDAFFR